MFFYLIIFFINTISSYGIVLGVIWFLAYISFLVFKSPHFFLSFSYFIIYLISSIIGVYIIETQEIYLKELAVFGFSNGSIWLILFMNFFAIQTFYFFYEKNNIEHDLFYPSFRISNYKVLILKILNIIYFALIMISFLRVIRYPAVFLGIDRFIYNRMYLSGIWQKINMLLLVFVPLASVGFMITKKRKYLLNILFLFIYLFWIGNKFGNYIIVSYWLLIPFIQIVSKKNIKKLFLVGIVFLVGLMGIINLQSSLIYHREDHSTYYEQRIAQQGQMWWSIYSYKELNSNKDYLSELSDETKMYFVIGDGDKEEFNYGIYKMMRLVTPSNIFNSRIYDTNSRYAFSSQASIYYYFNKIGLFLYTIIMSAMYIFIFRGYLNSVKGVDFVGIIIYTRLFLKFNPAFFQSDFDQIFSVETLGLLLVLGILYVLKKVGVKRL